MPAPYPEEFRRRAVDSVRANDESVSAVAGQLGIPVSGLRRWRPSPRSTTVGRLGCPPKNEWS